MTSFLDNGCSLPFIVHVLRVSVSQVLTDARVDPEEPVPAYALVELPEVCRDPVAVALGAHLGAKGGEDGLTAAALLARAGLGLGVDRARAVELHQAFAEELKDSF